MDFELKTLTSTQLCNEKCDALIVLVAESSPKSPNLVKLVKADDRDDAIRQLIAQAVADGDLETKAGQCLSSYRNAGLAATRIVLVGIGDGGDKHVRTAVIAAMNSLKTTNVKRVILSLANPDMVTDRAVRAMVTAGSDAAYSYTTTKSKPSLHKFEQIVIAVPDAAALQTAFDLGVALHHGVGMAKEWANRPANYATPALLADAAKKLGKLPKIKVDVLGPKEVAKLGMGSFMAVAQGSREPLRFIVMHYTNAAKSEAPTVLVGKGITFDTGGISIKPAAEMDEMKFDMCGAASVLGVFRALAELKPAINVVGLIPACENMPDGNAIKPGDVVTSMSGQTIEILNTDAEGRLVLCDALTYAERFKPRAVIDIATLTGACVVALGGVRSGLFSGDDALAAALIKAGEASHDLCWRMPLDDDYAEGLKTNFADVANVAGRAGGAVTAAKFLQRFTSQFAWAHLDIAGTAWKGGAAKGATGRPVGLLIGYLLAQVALSQQSVAPLATPPARRTKFKQAASSQ